METTVIHDERINRFEVFESGLVAYLEYADDAGVIDILHTVVPAPLEGQGIARALTQAAVDYALLRRMKIRPVCAYAKRFFERNRQYKEWLTE